MHIIRFYDSLLDSAAVLDRYDTTKSLYGHNIGRSYTNTGITSSSNSALLSHFKLDNNGTDAEGTENLTTQPSGYNAVVFSDKLNLFGTYFWNYLILSVSHLVTVFSKVLCQKNHFQIAEIFWLSPFSTT